MIDNDALKREMYDIVGVIQNVHKHLGPGLNESCYQEAMELQLKDDMIPYSRELSFHPTYRGKRLNVVFRIDFCVRTILLSNVKLFQKSTQITGLSCLTICVYSKNHVAF